MKQPAHMFFFRQTSSLWHVQHMWSALSLTLLLFLSSACAFSLGRGWKAAGCAPPPPGSRWYCIVFGGFMFPPWKDKAWNDIDIDIHLESNLRHMVSVNGLLLLLLLMHPRVHLLVLLGPTCNVGWTHLNPRNTKYKQTCIWRSLTKVFILFCICTLGTVVSAWLLCCNTGLSGFSCFFHNFHDLLSLYCIGQCPGRRISSDVNGIQIQ